MIHAYDEIYITSAQRILGEAVDFAVVTLGLEPGDFEKAFCSSKASRQFAAGNPRFVAGMNGCELARLVLYETNMYFTDMDDAIYIDKSPEYWAGWALAFFQWYTGYSFMHILEATSLEMILCMFPVYHEMDIMQFVDRMMEILGKKYPHTMLRMHRENCGYSQSKLAADSGVPLRQIQLFEQRQRNINKANAETILRLSRSLHCKMEDLLEINNLS